MNGVVKSIDAKLAAVGIMMEKVKSHCKGCPAVSFLFKNHFSTNLFSILSRVNSLLKMPGKPRMFTPR